MTCSIAETIRRIEYSCNKLRLDADSIIREYGVTTALADQLEKQFTDKLANERNNRNLNNRNQKK